MLIPLDRLGAGARASTRRSYCPGFDVPVAGAVPRCDFAAKPETALSGLAALNFGIHAPSLANHLFVTNQYGVL